MSPERWDVASPGTIKDQRVLDFLAGKKRRNVEKIQKKTAKKTVKIVRFVHRIGMTSQHEKVQGTMSDQL